MSIEPEPPDLPTPPLIDAVVPAAVAARVAGVSGDPHAPGHTHCENCGTALQGPFCHRCGQHDFEFHRSFRHVFLEALESFFHFEGKFFRNMVTLLFSPGRLTAEFNGGRRAAQMPPFRLYLFVSVMFFFLFFLGNQAGERGGPDEAGSAGVRAAEDDVPATLSSALAGVKKDMAENSAVQQAVGQIRTAVENKNRDAAPGLKSAAAPAAGRKHSVNPPFVEWLNAQGERAMDPARRKELAGAFIHSAPRMLLFCLPFFALFTRVLFRKSGQVYLQHLVLALHFHTFIYLWLLCRDGWRFLAGFVPFGLEGWVGSLCDLWLMLYPLLMLRRLFANSWPRTIVKTGLLALAYLFTLSGAFAATALVIFALL